MSSVKTPKLNARALTTQLEEYRPIVDATAAVHARRTGMDRETAEADALYYFVDFFVWLRENPQKCKRPITLEIRDHIRVKMIDDYRKARGRHGKRPKPLPLHDNIALMANATEAEQRARLAAISEDLDDDARRVVRLCIRPPMLLQRVIERKGGRPQNVRSSVRQYLRDDGWAASRIRRAFAAITEAL